MAHTTAPLDPPLALTFDDVLLLPSHSKILPKDTDIRSWFSRRIALNVPLASAAMDTVTEARLAIGMAEAGGIGVIHKNLTPEKQATQVRSVKKYEAGMVRDPITITQDQTIEAARRLTQHHKISGIPVVDGNNQLQGIVTNRDLRFANQLSEPVASIMTKKLITASEGISWNEARELLHKHRIEKLLIINTQGTLVGLMTVKDIEKAERHPLANKDQHGRLRVAAALAVESTMLQRAELLVAEGADALVVDSAHGHSQGVLDSITALTKEFGTTCDIIGGNVATTDGAAALIDCGADAIKVGIGPGSICTTRVVAGVGVPQWSAIKAAAAVCHQAGVPLIADGGICHSGDIAKAIAVGAHCVMMGSLLAGTDESPGETFHYEGRPCKVYRGMGSVSAMAEGSASRYFQNQGRGQAKEHPTAKFVPEGVEGQVPYKGALANILYQLVGGLRSAMGYIGANDITDMRKKAKFCRVTHAGMVEGHVHGVRITRQAPNYHIT